MTWQEKVIEIRKVIIDLNAAHQTGRQQLLDDPPQTPELVNAIGNTLHEILERLHTRLSELTAILENPD